MTGATYTLATDAGIIIFTASLLASLTLLLVIWPRDRLEWAITIKAASYFIVMARVAGVRFLGWPTENLWGLATFLLATVATAWFVANAWTDWFARRRAQGNGDDWNPPRSVQR